MELFRPVIFQMVVPVIMNANDDAVLNTEHGVEAELWFRGTPVFGLFCSSSNAMREVAARNGLNCCKSNSSWTELQRGGKVHLWKHSVPISQYDFGNNDVLCVCTVRNPVEWLISLQLLAGTPCTRMEVGRGPGLTVSGTG